MIPLALRRRPAVSPSPPGVPVDDARNQGSATRLAGLVYPLSVFLSERGSPWDDAAKQHALRNQRTAERWLCRQASSYGVTLAFHDGGCIGLDADVQVPDLHAAARNDVVDPEFVDLLLRIGGLSGALALYHDVVARTECGSVHVIVYANTRGRSFAVPFNYGMDVEGCFVEGCFVYRFGEGGADFLWPSVIAHEMLHVYGAWDLYKGAPGLSPQQAYMAQRLFSHDIMLSPDRSIRGLRVCELTAWRVGWTEDEKRYETFHPGQGPALPPDLTAGGPVNPCPRALAARSDDPRGHCARPCRP